MHELAILLLQNQPNAEFIQHMMLWIVPFVLVFMLLIIAVLMIPCWIILKKAGFTPWLALLCIVPSLGTLVLLYVLAFAQWKVVPAPQLAWAQAVPPPPQPPLPPQP